MLQWEDKRLPEPVAVQPAHLIEMLDPRRELPLARSEATPATVPNPDSFFYQALPNLLCYGDNQAVLAHLLANGWRGRVKLIYIDPPFDSGGDYSRKVRARRQQPEVVAQMVQYRDSWHGDSYLQFIYERLLLLRDLLADDGCIWLHCDYRQSHRLRLILEEVFGEENYLNTIAWRSQVARGAKVNAFYFPFSTQFLEIFAKNRQAPTTWTPQKKRLVFTRAEASAKFMEDGRGFFRTSDPGTYSFAKLKELHAKGRLYAPYGGEIVVDEENKRVYASKGGNIGIKYYLTKLARNRYGVERAVDNLWDDIPGLGTTPGEDVGYPTQKTEALLRRVIDASTQPGDLVLDCFLGSGTTAAVAQQMGRRWIGADLNYGAIQTARRRLQRLVQEQGPGFSIYALDDAPLLDGWTGGELSVTCHRRGDLIEVTIDDYVIDATRLPRRRLHDADDWRALVDAIDIDPEFDGAILRPTISDLPQKRREAVQGHYVVPIAEHLAGKPQTVAIRVTDIFGHERMVTQVIDAV